jgi:hypothetical protein
MLTRFAAKANKSSSRTVALYALSPDTIVVGPRWPAWRRAPRRALPIDARQYLELSILAGCLRRPGLRRGCPGFRQEADEEELDALVAFLLTLE